MVQPLKGLRVIELANVLAGPSVGLFLAEMGASVIKIENVRSCGDVTRHWKLPSEDPGSDVSGYFSCVNWGKRSLAVDITLSEGLNIVQRLASESDIVLASYKPGDAEKLGVDYQTLSRMNKRMIYAHITGYGTKNSRAGYDAIIQAESGFTFMNGEAGGRPTKMPVALMDVLAAHQVKEALLLALIARDRVGEGQYIEASLLKSGVASLANQATNWLVGKTIPQRIGSDHPNIVPYGTIFTTADGKDIVLAVGTDKQFGELCRILGRPDLAENQKFQKNYDRVVNGEELKETLQDLIGGYDRDYILDLFQGSSIPAGGVLDMQEVFEMPEAREMLFESQLDSGAIRGVSSVAFNASMLKTEKNLSPPPHYGQHSREVLESELGITAGEMDELLLKKVIYAKHS